jgi:hypothetical protein
MKSSIFILLLCLLFLCCSKSGSPFPAALDGANGMTAHFKLNAVEQLARASDSTLQLVSVGTNAMNTNGTSRSWSFTYARTALPVKMYFFTATFDSVILDSISSRILTGAGVITQEWINSSVAAELAENHGGKLFRQDNPDCPIQAKLGQAVVPSPFIAWYITYRSGVQAAIYRTFNIDAHITAPKEK